MRVNNSLENSIFRVGIDEKSHLKPIPLAVYITTLYIATISFYIWFSGKIALSLSRSIEDLAVIELTKGLLFVFITALALFFCLYTTLRKIEKKDNIILAQNKSIIASERLVMAGIFSSSVCHDINNIMSIIIGNTVFLSDSKSINSEDKESIEQISDSSRKIITLVQRMMEAGKGYIPGERKQNNLSDVLEETVNFARIHQKIKNCTIETDLQPNINITINSVLIGRTIMNLIINAADATNQKGDILVKLFRENSTVSIEVHDNGPGVAEDKKRKIFEPFYTSKIDGNGLGLLSLKICAQQHDGEISLKKSQLGGACFCLSFPIENKLKAQQ